MITETDLLETERLAKAAFSDKEKENHWASTESVAFAARMHPQCVLEMVEEIRSLKFCLENKSKEIGRSEHRGNTVDYIYDKLALYSEQLGNVVRERDKANEEIARLTKVNESHCRLWNEAEDDLKRTRGLLETAENALRYIVSRGYTGAEFVEREALEKIRESRGES